MSSIQSMHGCLHFAKQKTLRLFGKREKSIFGPVGKKLGYLTYH